MYRCLIIFCVLFVGGVEAVTKLKVPLFLKNGRDIQPAQKINLKYNLTGKGKIPEHLIIENTETSYNKAYDDFANEIPERIEALNRSSRKSFELVMGDYPTALDRDGIKTCYTGIGSEVINILDGISGMDGISSFLYDDDLVYLGWRIKEKIILSPFLANQYSSSAHANRFLVQNISAWAKWNENPMKITSILYSISYDDKQAALEAIQVDLCTNKDQMLLNELQ